MSKNHKTNTDTNRGANLEFCAALSHKHHENVEQATHFLTRHHLEEFKDHFSDENVTDILAENFIQIVDGLDWESYLKNRSTDSRALGSLITAYYNLIECSIWKCEEGPDGDTYRKACRVTSEVLRFLAQDIVTGIESERNFTAFLAFEGEVGHE